jgi:hypothetical protein
MVSVEQAEQTDLQAMSRLMELGDYIIPFALRVCADLAVADRLADGPLPVDRLAAAVGADTQALHRVLRALASKESKGKAAGGKVSRKHPVLVKASRASRDMKGNRLRAIPIRSSKRALRGNVCTTSRKG